MSATAIRRASVSCRIVSAWVVPRPPHPSSPTRTAEFACMPRTSCGFRIVNAAAPAAAWKNPRRPMFLLLIAMSPLAHQLFKKCLRSQDVLGLLRAFDLALDGDSALITDLLQQADQYREVDFALPDRHFAAELLGIGRIKSVFGVHAHDIRSEQLHGIQRIGLTVQDQVGYVEINPDIVQPDIFDGAHQRNRRLLPGLAAERLAVLFAVLG